MKVEVKETPIRHNGELFRKGDSFSVTEQEFVHLKKHVVVLEEDRVIPVSEMKLQELKAYAKKHGIDLGEATKREEVLAVIQKAGEADGGAS